MEVGVGVGDEILGGMLTGIVAGPTLVAMDVEIATIVFAGRGTKVARICSARFCFLAMSASTAFIHETGRSKANARNKIIATTSNEFSLRFASGGSIHSTP